MTTSIGRGIETPTGPKHQTIEVGIPPEILEYADGPAIPDLAFSVRAVHQDDRGAILHHLRSDHAWGRQIAESYISTILPGAIKAWKRHRRVAQNICVPVGEVLVVIIDQRNTNADADSFAKRVVRLSRAHHGVLHIPAGVWYGFQCLAPTESIILNGIAEIHDPNESERRNFDDPELPHQWQPPLSG